jgi:hypothetical protein
MISSFEVGSVFKIVDQATPVLRNILRGVVQIDEALSIARANAAKFAATPLAGLLKQMQGVSGEALAIDRNVAAAVASTSLMAKEWDGVRASAVAATRAINAATRASVPAAGLAAGGGGAGIPILPGRGGGRHGPRPGGFHVSGLSTKIPGGHMTFRGGGNAALATMGALGYGLYEEAEFEDAAFRAMFTAGVPTDQMKAQNRFKALRDMIQSAMVATGAPVHDLEEATLTGIRQFAGMPWEDRMKIMPQLLEAAAAEAKLKGGTTVEQGMESLTGLAHMTKSYTPEQIAKLAPKFAYLSATSPLKLKQIEGAAGYAVPLLQSGLEIDPFETLLLQATMQRAGILNTKSGTWIREMAKRAMPGTSLMSKIAFKKHESALREVGLVDDNDKPTWFNAQGKPDLIKMLDIAGENAQKIPLERRAGLEQALFGTQGAGAFSVLADAKIREQIKHLRGEMDEFKTGFDFFEKYMKESPVQQARVAWGELQTVLMDIGSVVLPPLNEALKQFAGSLRFLKDSLPAPQKGSLGEGMAPGAIIGGVVGLPFGLPWLGAAIGAVLGGLYTKSKGFADPWGDTSAGPQLLHKQSWNAPSQTQALPPIKVSLMMDRRLMGEADIEFQVRQGAGAIAGSRYFDPVHGAPAFDTISA